MLCCEALNLEGGDFCRGYIQNWLGPAAAANREAIPEKSAQKIFRAADQILRPDDYKPNKRTISSSESRQSRRESNANNPPQVRIRSVVLRPDRARSRSRT